MTEGRIEVGFARACGDDVVIDSLVLEEGTTVGQALCVAKATGLLSDVQSTALATGALTLAVHGRAARRGQPLRDQDRLELLAGLQVDPKVARLRRAARSARTRTGAGRR